MQLLIAERAVLLKIYYYMITVRPDQSDTTMKVIFLSCEVQVDKLSKGVQVRPAICRAYDYFGKNKRESKDNFPSIFDMSVLGGKKPCKELYPVFEQHVEGPCTNVKQLAQNFQEQSAQVLKLKLPVARQKLILQTSLVSHRTRVKEEHWCKKMETLFVCMDLWDSVKKFAKFEFGEDAH
ncbi:hypothetical protein MIR68_001642 [Amoeboaphelidium protococcarum]|nr:hypothetical protein MIR68_001642 [Amoeboaphelidium protococcarum]